jgi:DNA-binding NarL/FixJ family response regulator
MQTDDWRGEHLIRASKPDPNAGKDFVAKTSTRRNAGKRKARVEARRVKVRKLAEQGLTASQISKALDVRETSIRDDARAMKITLTPGVRTGRKSG